MVEGYEVYGYGAEGGAEDRYPTIQEPSSSVAFNGSNSSSNTNSSPHPNTSASRVSTRGSVEVSVEGYVEGSVEASSTGHMIISRAIGHASIYMSMCGEGIRAARESEQKVKGLLTVEVRDYLQYTRVPPPV